jgi:hypothetical protein
LIVGAWTARAIVNAVAVNQSGGFANWIACRSTTASWLHDRRRLPHRDRVRHRPGVVDNARRSARRDAPARARFDRRQQPVRLAQALVAFQVALAFVLVLGGSLLVRSFVAMTSQDLGFDRATSSSPCRTSAAAAWRGASVSR